MPSLEKVKKIVFAMDATSAVGPDGFGGDFYHKCWSIMDHDVVLAV